MNRLLTLVMSTFFILVAVPSLSAQEDEWPRTVPLDKGSMTIYRLQVDEMDGETLKFRAALAYRETADSEPLFGAGWFESQVKINSASKVVHPVNLRVTETRFPAGTDDLQSDLSAALARESATWNLDLTTDELQAALKQVEAESLAVQQLNTAPPKIIYRDHPALLVSLDGEPVLREIENSKYQAVINTPYPLIFDGKRYYLNAAKDVWYKASDATGPYQFDSSPPAAIAALVQPDEDELAQTIGETTQAAEPVTAANAPEIVVSTEPAELIVTEGPAAFVPLVDDLLVLQNSDDDVFMHVGSQQYYLVLAGRWYHSRSLNGPWEYSASDALPEAFANIPTDSDQADSRVYVAGTEEAREAVLDAQVPQTAAVARGEVDIDVEYDGQPDFERVDGTDMEYAENTGSTVIESNGLYYLVEDGVWYVSVSPNGPWQVADYRPQQVASIMPTSPVYNVKYVYVYDSTPSVVYVGYTPGYLGSYVHYNTIYYGTGWYYRPWVSPYYYYPRQSTWGWNVSYNSWYGWSFGFGWGWGPFNVHYYSGGYWHHNHYWNHGHYGRWGPRGYRPRHYARNSYGHGRGYGNGGYGRKDHGRGGDGRGDYGRGGRGYGGDGSNGRGRGGQGAGSGQRGDNLYRDSRQRALIADTRDSQRRTPGTNRNSDGMRQASYTAPSSDTGRKSSGKNQFGNRIEPVGTRNLNVKTDLQDQKGPGKSTAGRSRVEPVTVSELGDKARKRDQQFSGKNKGGRNQVEPVRVADLSNKARVRDQSASGKKSRDRNTTQPVRNSSAGIGTRAQQSDRQVKNQPVRNRTEPVGISGKTSNSRTTPAPSRRGVDRNSGATRVVSDRTSKRANRTEPAPSRRTVQNSNAPIQMPQYRTRVDSGRQRSAPVNSAPAPKQSSNRPVAPSASARTSGRGNSVSAPTAPTRGGPRAGGQRNSPKAGGSSRRAGGNRRQ